MPPRLVATDLDGTVVRSDGTMSPRTVDALTAVERAGATLVLVTGRPVRWLTDVVERLGHRGVVICSNGAIVFDLHTERVVESTLMPADTVAKVVEILLGALPELSFSVETGDEVFHSHGYRSGWAVDLDWVLEFHDLDFVASHPAAKLLASHPTMSPDELLTAMQALLGDLVEATHSNGRGLVEMGPAGVSKATSLMKFCAERGIARDDVVAFGDMPNDLAMLAWAGTSYAVANAHRDVLGAVELTTKSNDEDGVALVLEKLFAS